MFGYLKNFYTRHKRAIFAALIIGAFILLAPVSFSVTLESMGVAALCTAIISAVQSLFNSMGNDNSTNLETPRDIKIEEINSEHKDAASITNYTNNNTFVCSSTSKILEIMEKQRTNTLAHKTVAQATINKSLHHNKKEIKVSVSFMHRLLHKLKMFHHPRSRKNRNYSEQRRLLSKVRAC